jgi:prepilin-type N-terminal cleavage/methylation domain-containing protein
MSKFKSARKAFTLVEIMIVVLIIGILLAIAVPNFVRARAASRQKACVANLRQIESAKQQWAMDNRQPPTASPAWPADLVSAGGTATEKYIKGATPVCPTTGAAYAPNTVNTDATCPNATAPDGITGINHILNIP